MLEKELVDNAKQTPGGRTWQTRTVASTDATFQGQERIKQQAKGGNTLSSGSFLLSNLVFSNCEIFIPKSLVFHLILGFMTPNDSTSKQTPQNATVHYLTHPIFAPEVQNLLTRNGHFHSKMIFHDPAQLFCSLCQNFVPKIFSNVFQGLKYSPPTSTQMGHSNPLRKRCTGLQLRK